MKLLSIYIYIYVVKLKCDIDRFDTRFKGSSLLSIFSALTFSIPCRPTKLGIEGPSRRTPPGLGFFQASQKPRGDCHHCATIPRDQARPASTKLNGGAPPKPSKCYQVSDFNYVLCYLHLLLLLFEKPVGPIEPVRLAHKPTNLNRFRSGSVLKNCG